MSFEIKDPKIYLAGGKVTVPITIIQSISALHHALSIALTQKVGLEEEIEVGHGFARLKVNKCTEQGLARQAAEFGSEWSVVAALDEVQVRRSKAKESNTAIIEPPGDAKYTNLNKVLHAIGESKATVVVDDGKQVIAIPALDPRDLIIWTPPPKPEPVNIDTVCLGFKIIRHPNNASQEDPTVTAHFFLEHDVYKSVQVELPLCKCRVEGLRTRIKVRAERKAPNDTMVFAIELPDLSNPQRVLPF